jgi:hypothetical protein
MPVMTVVSSGRADSLIPLVVAQPQIVKNREQNIIKDKKYNLRYFLLLFFLSFTL